MPWKNEKYSCQHLLGVRRGHWRYAVLHVDLHIDLPSNNADVSIYVYTYRESTVVKWVGALSLGSEEPR